MTTDPDQIRRDIETTRASLSHDVDALAYKASPGRIVADRKQRMRNALHDAKETVMGTASSAAGAVQEAPDTLRRQAREGNPIAAGLVAFGVGWLVSSLIPASRREEQVAARARDAVSEHADTLRSEATDLAREARDSMREPTRDAVESVRSTAADATQAVKEESRTAAYDVRDRADQAREHVAR